MIFGENDFCGVFELIEKHPENRPPNKPPPPPPSVGS
jgi:hypothetical protein